MCATYFAYEVVTAVGVIYPSKMAAPTFSLCFWTITTVMWDKLDRAYPGMRGQMGVENITNRHELLDHMKRLPLEEKLATTHHFTNERNRSLTHS